MSRRRYRYRFHDADHNLLREVEAEDPKDAWRIFVRATELYNERPHYANEDIGETIAAMADSFRADGVYISERLRTFGEICHIWSVKT